MSIIPFYAVLIALGGLWLAAVQITSVIVTSGPVLWGAIAALVVLSHIGNRQAADFYGLDDDYPLIGWWEPPNHLRR